MCAGAMRAIVAIGDLVADLIIQVPQFPLCAGEHQLTDHFQLEAGGNGNFLVAGARLGAPMAAIGILGTDFWGREVRKALRAEQIDTHRVRASGSTTRVLVAVGSQGTHLFVGTYGQGPALRLTQADRMAIEECGALFIAGYALVDPRLAAATLHAVDVAYSRRVPVYVDPGPQAGAKAPGTLAHVLSRADTVLATDNEIQTLGGGAPAELLRMGPKTVVVKAGADGCIVYCAESACPIAGLSVQVTDTSAAGDCFDAAFIIGRQLGWSSQLAATFANTVGAAKVRKLGGGRNVPTLEEVKAVAEEFGVQLPQIG